jgi:hypothetical protein
MVISYQFLVQVATCLTMRAALVSAALPAFAASLNTDYVTPEITFSPDYRYGVMVPVFHVEAAQQPDQRKNKVMGAPHSPCRCGDPGGPGLRPRAEFPRDRSTTLVIGLVTPALEGKLEMES